MKITVDQVIERFRKYHEKNLAWGSLHVVLDDHNLGDKSVEHCIKWAREQGDTEGEELGKILLGMSKTQRGKIAKEA